MDTQNSIFCITVKQNEKIVKTGIKKIKDINIWELPEFTCCLKNASKIEYTTNNLPKKIVVSKQVLKDIDDWLKELLNKFVNLDIEKLEVILEILRFLRNCTSDLLTKEYILENTSILQSTDILFSKLFYIKHISLKVLIQFLINLVSSNKSAAEKIFKMFYDRIKNCLQSNTNTYESSALIYYISLLKPISDENLINVVLNLYQNNMENEFLFFFLENSISQSSFWNIYGGIKIENKITLFEILKYMYLQKQRYNLPLVSLTVFIEIFLKSTGYIFKMSGEEEKLKAYEISLLLDILSTLSSDEKYLVHLQTNNEILINACVLLINIHKLGKKSNNFFTPVQKLTEFNVNTRLNEHPAFGFKGNLIRLIGNLCWRNLNMQDLARNAEIIPIILDCCNMDARNPFIIQWSVLAVRNLCENNLENQKIIRSLRNDGLEVVTEMGVTMHSDKEGELRIAPLNFIKSG